MIEETSVGSNRVSSNDVSLNLSGATISVGDNSEDGSENNEVKFPNPIIPTDTSINVENSNDVVVGTVTQFHGPVTIYQNTHGNVQLENDNVRCLTQLCTDEISIPTNTSSAAKLVTADSLSRKPLTRFWEIQLKKKITLISLSIFASIILICVIIMVVGINVNNEYQMQEPQVDENVTPKMQLKGRHKLIYRNRWGGRKPLYERPMKTPVKYVIISHTAGKFCNSIQTCSAIMVQIQSQHVAELESPDIGYNFLIGGDENIYVGRGWDNHNFHMDLDTIGICFIGNYIYDILTPGMIRATHELLEMGVEHGKLEVDYKIYAHNQTFNTQSPGPNIYKQIKYWPHFAHELLHT